MTTAAQPIDRVLYTVKGAAELLSLGKSTVYELMAAGELPFVKVGRARRIRRTDVDAFAAQLPPQPV